MDGLAVKICVVLSGFQKFYNFCYFYCESMGDFLRLVDRMPNCLIIYRPDLLILYDFQSKDTIMTLPSQCNVSIEEPVHLDLARFREDVLPSR